MIYDKRELVDKYIFFKEVIIYGAGEVGKSVINFLEQFYTKDNVVCVAVSSEIKNKHIFGIEVKKINELLDQKDKLVLIATKEETSAEIREYLEMLGFTNIEQMDDSLCDWLIQKKNGIRRLEEKINQLQNKLETQSYQLQDNLLKFVPKPCLEYMVLNILDHCNLRCKGCDHFACIADPYFVSYETIHNDLQRMSELLGDNGIIKMGIMGGEPLLHPDLLKILEDVRLFFPKVIIRLTTNGLLLLRQNDEFWHTCRKCNVTIVNTKYPINLDFEGMKKKAESENVKFMYFEDTGEEVVKKSFKKIINLNGDNDPVESFANCHIANYGNFLMEGKFYGCPFSCQSYRIFNKKFEQALDMTDNDYLDIYRITDKQELFNFAARPKYYCRYCSGLQRNFDWERSKQEMSEWVE